MRNANEIIIPKIEAIYLCCPQMSAPNQRLHGDFGEFYAEISAKYIFKFKRYGNAMANYTHQYWHTLKQPGLGLRSDAEPYDECTRGFGFTGMIMQVTYLQLNRLIISVCLHNASSRNPSGTVANLSWVRNEFYFHRVLVSDFGTFEEKEAERLHAECTSKIDNKTPERAILPERNCRLPIAFTRVAREMKPTCLAFYDSCACHFLLHN